MAKILSSEDNNLTSSIAVARNVSYKDIDLTLSIFDDTGDIYTKSDAAAVKQSVKTLMLTDSFERPFRKDLGAGLDAILFNSTSGKSESYLRERIVRTITKYEPRAIINSVRVNSSKDNNTVSVRLEFRVKNFNATEVIETTLSRLR